MKETIRKDIVLVIIIAAFCGLYILTGPHDNEPTPGESAVRGIVAPGAGEQIDAMPPKPRVTLREYYEQHAEPDHTIEDMSELTRRDWERRKSAYLAAVGRPGGELTKAEETELLGYVLNHSLDPGFADLPRGMVLRNRKGPPPPDWIDAFEQAALAVSRANDLNNERRQRAVVPNPTNPKERSHE